MSSRPTSWTMTSRYKLKNLLMEGYTLSEIARELGISRPTLSTELHSGLNKNDSKQKRYIRYNPALALRKSVIRVFGEDAMSVLLNYEEREDDKC